MNKIDEKFNEIRLLVIRRFIVKMSSFFLLCVAGIVFPLVVRTWHLFGRASFGQERPDNVFGVLAVGIGILGIITSVQYLYNSLKVLKEKMKKISKKEMFN
jgi:hypothetical protein